MTDERFRNLMLALETSERAGSPQPLLREALAALDAARTALAEQKAENAQIHHKGYEHRERMRLAEAALGGARQALAAAESRLAAYRPIVEQAVAWRDWSDGTDSPIDQELDALRVLVEALPDELYYELVDDGPAPATDGAAATAGGDGTLCER